jgi:hypothetical protein
MNPKTIDAIRDLAITFEKTNLQIAYELMSIAYKERPQGPFIYNKFLEYKQKLEAAIENAENAENAKLLSLIRSGEVAIIPIGFRCYTSMMLEDKLGLSQASLPFDSGFFSPHSVASVFESPTIALSYADETTHTVCKKFENYNEELKGVGIKFELSSYEEIDNIVSSKNIPNINQFLDSTFGYYTLDKKHKFILAHYNWHAFADDVKSKGVKNPEDNLPLINKMVQARIERMLELCHRAKYIFFVHLNENGNYIKIGDEYFDLTDYSELEACLDSKYDFKYSILNAQDVSAQKMLDTFEKKTNKAIKSDY